MRGLLDVNVLLALGWPAHIHHVRAWEWFRGIAQEGWATCAMTEAGFARISCNSLVSGEVVTPIEAIRVLDNLIAQPNHTFLPLDQSLTDLPPAIRDRLTGAGQITDAILLAAAIRHNCQLATFDVGLANLVSDEDRRFLHVIPA